MFSCGTLQQLYTHLPVVYSRRKDLPEVAVPASAADIHEQHPGALAPERGRWAGTREVPCDGTPGTTPHVLPDWCFDQNTVAPGQEMGMMPFHFHGGQHHLKETVKNKTSFISTNKAFHIPKIC